MNQGGNTVLITGGGSGIGAALSQRLHDAGNRVVVAGRRPDALAATIAGRERMHGITFDTTDPDDVARFARRVIAEHPSLNILVNNAGIMRFEALDRARDLADAAAMIETNLIGPIRLVDALVEHLAAQPDAVIVNMTSGLAFVPLVAAPTYSATKAALHSYTMALRVALAGRVEVIEIAPPGVQTALTPGQDDRPGYQPLDEFADEVMTLLGRQPTPPEILVERVVPFRRAEADGQFAARFEGLNAFATAARGGGGGAAEPGD